MIEVYLFAIGLCLSEIEVSSFAIELCLSEIGGCSLIRGGVLVIVGGLGCNLKC